jgi:iron-sulfur cluster assembly protein
VEQPVKLFITEPALKAIDLFLSKRKQTKLLRLGVRGGGGCSGYKYSIECGYSFTPSKDYCFVYDDIRVVVDKKSMFIMNGSTLFLTKTPTEQGLKFYNPNAKSFCSCGKSFSV